MTLPLESLSALGAIALTVVAVLLESWEGGLGLIVGILS